MNRLILASASPRRRELLARLGLSFEVHPSMVDETAFNYLPPALKVEQLALAKARAVARTIKEGLIIGADTIVVCDGRVLEKPKSREEAAAMLFALSGRTHTVYTGVAVVRAPGNEAKSSHAVTDVTFRRLTPEVIAAYVATGEPMDKAGAYGIQGRGALLVEGINGDYFNVVGLPLVKVTELLEQFGVDIWGGKGE
ncbi:MAG: septum formation inhibitor Maf [Moorella humiferrea]|uniref:dTTP/UTP pyrophosphatase n=1 Tax=Neomoorella humiferrea TaxID=676965 RepID=A0A2T0AW98_9FIRM|nr:Maf family protein [Moorella humiferrea]MBE3572725.1 septum formation inhibitor Maf [Moorella humiferrea]PRR74995.1 Maf-like protein YhdE [Moorella humiferrea]